MLWHLLDQGAELARVPADTLPGAQSLGAQQPQPGTSLLLNPTYAVASPQKKDQSGDRRVPPGELQDPGQRENLA